MDLLLVVVTPLTIITTVRAIEVHSQKKVNYLHRAFCQFGHHLRRIIKSTVRQTPTVLDGDWVLIHFELGDSSKNQSSAPTTNIRRKIIHKFSPKQINYA
ncbi:hypothetical protein D5E82_23360 [Vibrio parahaemolyticus]|nr:hypothetical protein D5E82_23360 [Vibrio parahaemolyticus]TBT69713.1 hypothetical protein D5E74_23955 [Vibrio parahaemolyticus]